MPSANRVHSQLDLARVRELRRVAQQVHQDEVQLRRRSLVERLVFGERGGQLEVDAGSGGVGVHGDGVAAELEREGGEREKERREKGREGEREGGRM